MSLDDIKTLIAVANAGSVRDGAKAIFKTQPAASQALKRIETEYGLTLFDRKQYRFTLTDKGEQFVQRAKRLLNEAQSLTDYAEHLNSGVEHRFVIAVHASVDAKCYLPVLAAAQKAFPDTQFVIQQEEVGGAVSKLMKGEVNLSISPYSSLMPSAHKMETLVIENFELINVCHRSLIEGASQPLSTFDVAKWHQIVLDANTSNVNFGILDGNRRWFCNTETVKKRLICSGLGWGRLSANLVENMLKSGELVELNIEGSDSRVSAQVHVLRNCEEQKGPIAKWIWQTFSQQLN